MTGRRSTVRHQTDAPASICEAQRLIHSQECGLRRRAAPQQSTMLALSTRLPTTPSALWAGIGYPLTWPGDRPTPISVGQGLLAMPFDALRFQYASAVRAGMVQRSSLASGKLERTLDALEKLILGPLARQR